MKLVQILEKLTQSWVKLDNMKLSAQDQKNVQALMKDQRWASVDNALKAYLMENFVQTSIKRDNEFETMWCLAFNEGGKDNLQRFMSELINQAKQV